MEWICKWFIQYYSQQQWQTDHFHWYYQRVRVTSSILWIKVKFSLAFIYALILLLGSFLLLARCSAVCEKKRMHSLLIPPKHENISGVNDLRSTWRIHWLYSSFFSFSFFLWTAGILWCKWHLANGLKTLMSQKAICLFIHNPLADISALAWLLIFEDFGSSSPVNGVSNDSVTTFLHTSPRISAVRFLSLLCLVITSPPFGQDKACCKLNESPQTHSVDCVNSNHFIRYKCKIMHFLDSQTLLGSLKHLNLYKNWW